MFNHKERRERGEIGLPFVLYAPFRGYHYPLSSANAASSAKSIMGCAARAIPQPYGRYQSAVLDHVEV